MRHNDRDNIKKLWSLFELWSLQKRKTETKQNWMGVLILKEGLFWNDSKSICNNNDNKNDYSE